MVRYLEKTEVDFVVIGGGGAGAIVAKELSAAGFQVVILEQGPYLHESDFEHDELKFKDIWEPPGNIGQEVLTNNHSLQPNTFRKAANEKAVRAAFVQYGRCIGGGTVHFTGNYWRFHEIDFHERSRWGETCRAPPWLTGPSPIRILSPITPRPNGNWVCRAWPARALLTHRDRNHTLCLRCLLSLPVRSWNAVRESWAGTPTRRLWRFYRNPIKGVRPARIADSAISSGVSGARNRAAWPLSSRWLKRLDAAKFVRIPTCGKSRQIRAGG